MPIPGRPDRRSPTPAQLAGLRAHATRQREDTVRRVRDAIAALGDHVTAAGIERLTGIGFSALRRNAEAYAEFRRHSAGLRAKREARAAPRRRNGAGMASATALSGGAGGGGTGHGKGPGRQSLATGASPCAELVQPYDPLRHRTKAWLVAALRAARAEHDDLQQRYHAVLQDYMQLHAEVRELRRLHASMPSTPGQEERQREATRSSVFTGHRP